MPHMWRVRRPGPAPGNADSIRHEEAKRKADNRKQWHVIDRDVTIGSVGVLHPQTFNLSGNLQYTNSAILFL